MTEERPIGEQSLCETIFGEYLITKAVTEDNERAYEDNLKMVILYRDCFSLMARSDLLDLTGLEHATNGSSGGQGNQVDPESGRTQPNDFEALDYPDLLPTISNEFVLRYAADLSDKQWMPKRAQLIKMIEDFCGWLKQRDYTANSLVRNTPNARTKQ